MTGIGKILYLPPRGIGDLIFSLPLLHSLHSALPLTEIEIPITDRPALKQIIDLIGFVKPCDVYMPKPSEDPLADQRWRAAQAGDSKEKYAAEKKIFEKYLKGRSYDLVVLGKPFKIDSIKSPQVSRKDLDDIGYDWKKAHMVDGFLEFTKVLDIPSSYCFDLQFNQDADARTIHGSTIAVHSPYVILNLGTSDEKKKWSPLKFKQVADYLANRGISAVVVGTGSEYWDSLELKENSRLINLVPKDGVMLDMRNYAVLASRARAVISPDTGLLHLADAVGTSCIGLYGFTDPSKFAPYNNQQNVISRNDSDKLVSNIPSKEVIAKLEEIL